MKNLLGNYVLIKKSSIVIMAVIGIVGFCAWKYYLKEKGVDPAEDAKQVAKKGARKAKEMAEDATDDDN